MPHSIAALLQPPTEYETGWAPEPVWIFWRRVQSLPSARNQTLHRPDGSLVTTSTILSLLYMLSSHQRLNLPSNLLQKPYMHFCSLSLLHALHVSPTHPPLFDHPNFIIYSYVLRSFLLYRFLQPPVPFSL